jgi:hypothetical protein
VTIITAGVLIALALEGAVSWLEHRSSFVKPPATFAAR